MDFYSNRYNHFTNRVQEIKVKYNIVSLLRLAIIVISFICIYYAVTSVYNAVLLCAAGIGMVLFIYLIRLHTGIKLKRDTAEALAAINKNEDDYLNSKALPFNRGIDFIDYKHPYSYDLDIFGNKSLYQHINRTYTFKGGKTLANLLLTILPQHKILQNQEAVKELAGIPEWRQYVMALGYQNPDSEQIYKSLINWSTAKPRRLPAWLNVMSFIMPVMVLGPLFGYIIYGNQQLLPISGYLFPVNIMLLSLITKLINKETGKSTEIHSTLENYSRILHEIEIADFNSEKLKALQQKLSNKGSNASSRIKKLSELFSRIDTINNLFVMVVFNGFFLFHVHVMRALIKWKEQNSDEIKTWMEVIGETEALSSIGNLYYNNPDFTFPVLNNNYNIKLENLGHPLINKNKRVGNNVNFNPQFIILTGSNMSGKSTFLRSLGINMVLAGMGAPVCAENALIHPLPILVSMRLSDSLSDSESYFFAEIKRLKLIMDALENQRAFILLDEILRGTNSDDKQSGTIAVIKKMLYRQAIGAIATHDIEVCNITKDYPEFLSNQCFEVQIVNNELYFDYTLRNGICKNKSATFIMDKMGVI